MNTREPEALPEGGSAKAAAGLLEGFLRDALINGAVFLSLIVVVAGFVTKTPGWISLGVVVGGLGTLLPWTAVGRRWPTATTWIVITSVYVADIAALALIVLVG